MFCNKCGKQVPDDSQFCPYCGNNLEAVDKTPIHQHITNNHGNMNDGKVHIGQYAYDAKEFLKIEKYRPYFVTVSILNYISIAIYIAILIVVAVLSNEIQEQKQWAIVFQKVFSIIVSIYSLCYAGLMISSIFIIYKHKQFAHGLKFMIIAKAILSAMAIVLSILLIINIGNDNNKNVGVFISTIIFAGFCFFVSGVNATVSSSCVIPKKYFDKAKEIVNKPIH